MMFFDVTPRGRILNRVSKDTQAVDEVIPEALQGAVFIFITLVATIINICVLSWPSIIIAIPSLVLFVGIYQSFRSVSPQFKRLDALTRSPVMN